MAIRTFYDWVDSLPRKIKNNARAEDLRAVYDAPHPRVDELTERLRKIVKDWSLIGSERPLMVVDEVREALEWFDKPGRTEAHE